MAVEAAATAKAKELEWKAKFKAEEGEKKKAQDEACKADRQRTMAVEAQVKAEEREAGAKSGDDEAIQHRGHPRPREPP